MTKTLSVSLFFPKKYSTSVKSIFSKLKIYFFCKVSVTVELKSWRQIYLNSYFRIPSVYWEIIKCVGERLDILCQNIVKIHTILYQTLQTKQLCLRSSLSYFIIPTRLILNLEFHFEWNSRKMFFSECTTIFRALFWLLRLSSLFQISRRNRNYNGN